MAHRILLLLLMAGLPPTVTADTSVVEYHFRTQARFKTKTVREGDILRSTLVDEVVEPEQFGLALVATDSKKFVYQLWPKGKSDRIHVAAGFDGNVYWYLLNGDAFSEDSHATVKPNRKARAKVRRTSDASEKSQTLFKNASGTHSPTWFTSDPEGDVAQTVRNRMAIFDSVCHLHNLQSRLGINDFEKGSFDEALQKGRIAPCNEGMFHPHDIRGKPLPGNWLEFTPKVKAADGVPPHWGNSDGGWWAYEFTIDQHPVCLRKMRVSHAAGFWTGPWPFPVPSWFDIVRVGNKEVDDDAFSWKQLFPLATVKVISTGSEKARKPTSPKTSS